MAAKTEIQWADTTVNPVMGCDGCELYPTAGRLRSVLSDAIAQFLGHSPDADLIDVIGQETKQGPQFVILHKEDIALALAKAVSPKKEDTKKLKDTLEAAIRGEFRCYAAVLHRFANSNGNHPGFASPFEQPKLFPGRTAETAALRPLDGLPRPGKGWADGCRRLIFTSDMGDALSDGVTFDYLKTEIIDVVTAPDGRRHIWLWLTKRPERMAEFATWLAKRGIAWPDNLVAMTSVTSTKSIGRIATLLKVPAKYHGLSIEPLWDEIRPDLTGIDFVIVGGESGGVAKPFHVEWIAPLQEQARAAGAAFFVKQLGVKPYAGGQPLELADSHGGDWDEWPAHLRVREFPAAWRQLPAGDKAQG